MAYLYDQSAGHTKIRSDGLSVNQMNVSPGGAVPLMRSTIIPDIGPYQTTFKVGDEQDLVFTDGDEGPFWLNESDKLSTKNDILSGLPINKELSKCELLIRLRNSGYDTTKKRYLKKELNRNL